MKNRLLSLSKNDREFIHGCVTVTSTTNSKKKKNLPVHKCSANGTILRIDRRGENESRPIRFTFYRDECFSQCIVQFYGGTSYSCKEYELSRSISATTSTVVESTVSCMLVAPSMDRPNQGKVCFNVEYDPNLKLLSLNNISQEKNRIIRLLEQVLLFSPNGAINLESLCISSNKWVWSLSIELNILQNSGNITDACFISVIGALEYLRLPEVDMSTSKPLYISSYLREPVPLTIHYRPLAITYALYSHPKNLSSYTTLVDPSIIEESIQDGRLTVVLNKYSEICTIDFPGGCELKISHLSECLKLATDVCIKLDKVLENALERTNGRSLHSLKREESLINCPKSFFEREFDEYHRIVMSIDLGDDIQKITENNTKEEEEYKLQALDYSTGHIAGKVRDSTSNPPAFTIHSDCRSIGKIMFNMLQIAKKKMKNNGTED